MTDTQALKSLAVSVIENEYKAIQHLTTFINDDFIQSINAIHQSNGRVVVSGIGKSALIANKIVATMNSTGTPSVFMHAADALHGDLGIMQPDDMVIIISKSGESPEIKALLPMVKRFGNRVIAICGNEQSFLATGADWFINSTIAQEACPNNLAPTTSTTAQLVMGDAMAVCLLQMKGFSAKDFARFHPGGALGKRLYLTVQDLSKQNAQPEVDVTAHLKAIILEISGKLLGATAVTENGKLIGIITDGDLRRMLESQKDTEAITAQDICSLNPKTIAAEELAVNALAMMRENNITQVLVTRNGVYEGMVHLHDLIREGII